MSSTIIIYQFIFIN